MKTTLDRHGRIVIPKKVRENFGLHAGSVLEIETRSDRIVLAVQRDEPDLVREGCLSIPARQWVSSKRQSKRSAMARTR